MKKVLLTSVALASVVSASSVLAADLPSHKAPPMMTSISPWQGVYAGINAGYGLNNITQYDASTGVYPQGKATYSTGAQDAVYVGGAVAGAQLGYNHVFANHWMMGAEVDFDWADIYNNTNPTQGSNYNVISGGITAGGYGYTGTANIGNYYTRLGLDWIGTVRARIGYDMGKFLPYITGGFAYGGLSYTTQSTNAYGNMGIGGNASSKVTTTSITTGSSSTVGLGWAAGAGAEYMVTDNWSVKAEYLFTSIGGITTPTNSISTYSDTGTFALGSGSFNTGSFGVHQVRAGLNYHTNWWGAAPVVAKF